MRSLPLVLASLLGAASQVASAARRPCGFKIAPCPTGEVCEKVDPSCTRGENCLGVCVPATPTATTLSAVVVTATTTGPTQTPTYKSCGGRRVEPVGCADGEICIDDPRPKENGGGGGCGLACDEPGICVKPVFCGGIAGIPCADGKICVDDPRDDCDPKNGGADCGGICV